MSNQTSIVLAAVAAGLAGYVAGGAVTAGALGQGHVRSTLTYPNPGSESDSQLGTDRYNSRQNDDRPAVILTSRSRFMD